MSVAVIDFEWPIHKAGHRFLTFRGVKMVTTGRPVSDLKRRDHYEWLKPFLEAPTLFRDFAEWSDSDEAILAFTDRFGLLVPASLQMERPFGKRQAWACPLHAWRKMRRDIAVVLREWDLVQRRDESGLLALEAGDRASAVATMDDPSAAIGIPPMIETGLPRLVNRGAYRILWDINYSLVGMATPELAWDAADERPRLRVTPGNLAGVLWLQTAEFVAGVRNYRACAVCGKHMEISTETTGHRTNRLYCSDACRFKAYRRRKSNPGAGR